MVMSMNKDELLSIIEKHFKRSKLEEEKAIASPQRNYAEGKMVAYKYAIKKIKELER